MSVGARGVEIVVARPSQLGEGAFWNPATGLLHWVDILDCKVFAFDPRTGVNREWSTASYVGTVVPAANGDLVLAVHHEVVRLNPATRETTTIARLNEIRREIRFNDGKCDPAGRLWVGTCHMGGQREQGALYRLDPGGRMTCMFRRVSTSNGIVWSLDDRRMHYIDSDRNDVRTFDFDAATGAISNERIALRNEHGGHLDGMTIDAEGMLWIAVFGVGQVRRYDPGTGALLRTIAVPASQTTSCAFGGPDLDELYITTAGEHFTAADRARETLAGSLFRVRPGVAGVPMALFTD